jgi:predicted phosphate transport protein (TIGR00153 family)
MRLPFISKIIYMPFDGVLEHAEKVKECGWAFQQAMECFGSGNYERFEEYRNEVDRLESEADVIKRRIRSAIPRHSRLPVEKFQLFLYIKEQDHVLDSVEDCLNWIGYRKNVAFPEPLKKDFYNFVDSVMSPIEELCPMVQEAKKYFEGYSERQRKAVIEIIHNLRKNEHAADLIEDKIKQDIFNMELDPITFYHMMTLTDLIGSIADYAENAGDMMRAMLSK